MGVKDYRVFGKIRFEKEQQFTHLQLIIEATNGTDAMEKANKISDKVHWNYYEEYKDEEE